MSPKPADSSSSDDEFMEFVRQHLESVPLEDVRTFASHLNGIHEQFYNWLLWVAAPLINDALDAMARDAAANARDATVIAMPARPAASSTFAARVGERPNRLTCTSAWS